MSDFQPLREKIAKKRAWMTRPDQPKFMTEEDRAVTREVVELEAALYALEHPDVETPPDTEGALARVQRRRELDSAYDDLQRRLARTHDPAEERRLVTDILAVRAGLVAHEASAPETESA